MKDIDDRIVRLLGEIPPPAVRPDLLAQVARRRLRQSFRRTAAASLLVIGALIVGATQWPSTTRPEVVAAAGLQTAHVTLVLKDRTGERPFFVGDVDYTTRSSENTLNHATIAKDVRYEVLDRSYLVSRPEVIPESAEWTSEPVTGAVTWKNLAPAHLRPDTLLADMRALGVPLVADPLGRLVDGVPVTRWTAEVTRAQSAHDPMFDSDAVELLVDDHDVARAVSYTLRGSGLVDVWTFTFTQLDQPVRIAPPAARLVIDKHQFFQRLTDIACSEANQKYPAAADAATRSLVERECTYGSYPMERFVATG